MHASTTLFTKAVIALTLLHLPGLVMALTCEELRAAVEAKIQSKGVTQFKVSIVEMSAPAAGQVVGSCDRGTKKLLYVQGKVPVPATAAVASQPKPAPAAPPRVITECADGRVVTQGSCKR